VPRFVGGDEQAEAHHGDDDGHESRQHSRCPIAAQELRSAPDTFWGLACADS
jgi:hypothetical protein